MAQTTRLPPLLDPANQQSEVPRPRRSRARILVAAILALGVVGVFAWLVSWRSPVPVRSVEVRGASAEMQRQIRTVAAIREGTPIREIDAAAVSARVDALPGIEGTSLALVRPMGVAIEVIERFPYATVPRGDSWEMLDSSGQSIREVTKRPLSVPKVVAEPGQHAEVLPAIAMIPEDVRSRFIKVVAAQDDPLELRMTLDNGATVDWGAADRAEEKATVLLALLAVRADGYVVRVPDRPALVGTVRLPKPDHRTAKRDRNADQVEADDPMSQNPATDDPATE